MNSDVPADSGEPGLELLGGVGHLDHHPVVGPIRQSQTSGRRIRAVDEVSQSRPGYGVGLSQHSGEEVGMKFLVVWKMEISRLSADMMKTVLRMPDYAKPLEERGKVVGRYHIVGYHGGAWIFDVESNDELEMLLAQAPVYNFSHFEVYPLADMTSLPVIPPEQ